MVVVTLCFQHYQNISFLALELSLHHHWTVFPQQMTTIDTVHHSWNILLCSMKLNEQIYIRACWFLQLVDARERFNLFTELLEALHCKGW